MSIEGGFRNTTMLVLVICVPLLVASYQHTFGLSAPSPPARATDKPLDTSTPDRADTSMGRDSTSAEPTDAAAEPELLVSVNSEPDAGLTVAVADTESAPPAEQPADNVDTDSADADSVDTGSADADQDSVEAATAASQAAIAPANSVEVADRDATAEFEAWIATVDDDIRQSVLREITDQLETATENFDKRQVQLERLKVETEFYRMQIQHLQSRLQEWKSDE